MKDESKNRTISGYALPDNLQGRSIHSKVIPTVCNLKNMLEKLIKANGDFAQLKPWEKRSYQAYGIDKIANRILISKQNEWKDIIRERILLLRPSAFGASVIDIYLVAYVAETFGPGREVFYEYVKNKGISDKKNSAQAIWQVGKGDGIYLKILHENGKIKDWDFVMKWIGGE